MAITITKASGQTEEFHIQKLVDSLIRSGASEELAWDIAKKIEIQITPSSHTKHIFRMAKRLLRQYNRVSDMRYSIKKSIYSLGPAGYQFEKYFARILREYGYSVETNRTLNGFCVTHEVDVFASRDGKGFVIECKYHSNSSNPTDVKVALYIYSRFSDIRKAYELLPEKSLLLQQGWLVTNTRCTTDARKFAECAGLKIVSWKYPEKESLEKMIENKRLYPVTILSSIRKNSLEILFSNDILLAKDIADMDEQTFKKRSGLDGNIARILKREADELCIYP
jgi:predicted RecB family endonuclease